MPAKAKGIRRNRHHVGPFSKSLHNGAAGATIDRRTREGRFLREYAEQLKQHVGGSPTIVQTALIHQACRLALMCALMDEKMEDTETPEISDRVSRQYLAWSNALSRLLVAIGVQAAGRAKVSPLEYAQQQRGAALVKPSLQSKPLAKLKLSLTPNGRPPASAPPRTRSRRLRQVTQQASLDVSP
jgi:hypothetical protein